MADEGNPRKVFHPDLAPPAPQGGQPEAPESTEGDEGETGDTVFVGGRERTVEEVVRGYEASTAEAMRLKAQYDAALAERDALRREADAYRNQLTRPVESEPELPEDADPRQLAAWVAKLSEKRARETAAESVKAMQDQMQSFFSSMQGLMQAQAEMKGIDPDFDANKLTAYLQANPDVQKRYNSIFAVDQAAALEYGWSKARSASSAPASPRAVQSPSRRKAPPPDAQAAQKARLAAIEEAERTGNYEKYYALRAKGTSIERDELKPQ